MAHAEVEERQLLKAMTWWDGFVVALANPGFLIAALGASIGVLGTTGAFVLWTISVLLGALQNNVYAEMATMFPQKAGGISLYAHEAWRKYLSFDRPDRDVRLLVRMVERAGDQRLRDRDARAGRVVRGHDVHPGRRQLPVEPAGLDRHRLHHRRLALQHLRRTARGVAQLRDRRPADSPRRRPDVPPVHHRRLVERQHDLGDRQRRRPRAGAHLALLHGVVRVRLRNGGGVRAGIPQPRVGHPEGAARLGGLLGGGVRAAAARRRRNARHRGHRRATRRRSPSTRRPSTCSSAMRLRTCWSCA